MRRFGSTEELGYPLRARDGRRYSLLEVIGRGATGTAYRALDANLDLPREVCVKRLSTPVDPSAADDLRREAGLLSSLRHANVVSLLGIGQEEESGWPFLVLELVKGPNLRGLCRGLAATTTAPVLPWRLAVHTACALLRALGAAARALPGIVHRDVTPHNVLVSTEGEVKLADFGIALTRERATQPTKSMVRGKLGYMAPEQVRGERLDVRTDLYAVGVVLYELLAGRRPAADAKGRGEMWAMERGQLDALSSRRPDLDARLSAAVERLLSTVPADRYASPEDALRALAAYGAGELGALRMADLVNGVAWTGSGFEARAESEVVRVMVRRRETRLERSRAKRKMADRGRSYSGH